MSQVVSTPQQINQHPVNNSTSKQLFSFSKAERFGQPKSMMNHRIAYDLPSMKSTRAAGLGYGSRNAFNIRNDSPSPTNYNLKSEFTKSPSNKAFSFGISREAYSKVYIKENPLADASVPGPGQYQIPPIVGKEALKYTLRPKTQNPYTQTYKGQPGPGQYDTKPALNDKGLYFNSKFKNSSATSIDPPSSVRFKDINGKLVFDVNNIQILGKRSVPGPGTYQPNIEMNKTGSYFVSNFQSSMCRSHYHFDRQTNILGSTMKGTPGPGNYRLPSDFGYYEASKKLSNTQSNFFSTRNSDSKQISRMGKSASQPHLDKDKHKEL
eukprot:403348945